MAMQSVEADRWGIAGLLLDPETCADPGHLKIAAEQEVAGLEAEMEAVSTLLYLASAQRDNHLDPDVVAYTANLQIRLLRMKVAIDSLACRAKRQTVS